MRVLEEYNIQFEGLKEGVYLFEYNINNEFFKEFDCEDFEKSEFYVMVHFEKKSGMLVLDFDIKGYFKVPCDRCLDLVEISLATEEQLIVKFGNDNYIQTDEIIMLNENDYEINVAKNIYEFIMLNIPQKRIHKKKDCNQKLLEKLEKIVIKKEEKVDPRWEKLKHINIEN